MMSTIDAYSKRFLCKKICAKIFLNDRTLTTQWTGITRAAFPLTSRKESVK